MFSCPTVKGSKEPGKMAVLSMFGLFERAKIGKNTGVRKEFYNFDFFTDLNRHQKYLKSGRIQYRQLRKSGMKFSELSLGTWQVGGKWGSGFDEANADRILNAAIDQGVNFIDTADVYEDGRSEKAVGRVVRSRSEELFVATKCGRQIQPHVNAGYTPDVLQRYV